MKFRVDLNACQSMGQCSFTAPDLFPLDDDGVLEFAEPGAQEYVSEELTADDGELAEEASFLCPMRAISMH
ncbi:ferredoxin (plasmid) [Mycolicibacterium madagascariense]|uniref:Ferredoxin n=1 Tax=Mycolicibacterium madagascariense TaxID=212765 RepID=A0A7I7XPU1_9MYCO|nr:ferredoxin [Mycolicibacterium madagascariense]BBZ31246.1 ferredoxin [Mycolicibacterium madagascariense]